MQRKEMRQRIIDNFDKNRFQHHQRSPYTRITPENVFQMLSEVSGRFKTDSTRLLYYLETHRWYVHTTAHEGGSDPSAPWHITLMAPRGVHLNCRLNPDRTLHIYEITWD